MAQAMGLQMMVDPIPQKKRTRSNKNSETEGSWDHLRTGADNKADHGADEGVAHQAALVMRSRVTAEVHSSAYSLVRDLPLLPH